MQIDLIQKLALHNALSDTLQSFIRKAYKHYSRTYHTPLSVAMATVTEYEAVLVYFEDRFGEMDAVQLKDASDALYARKPLEVINAGPQKETLGYSSANDEAWVAQMNLKLKRQEDEQRAKQVVSEVDKAIAELNKTMEKLSQDEKKS